MNPRADGIAGGKSTKTRVAAVAATALLTGFVALATVAAGAGDVPGDVRFLTWLQGQDWPLVDTISEWTNWLFDGGPVTVLGITCLVGALAVGWRTEALCLAVAGIARLMNGGLKLLIDSPRPGAEFIREAEPPTSNGFPSGHTASAVLVCGTLAWVLSRHVRSGPARATVWVLAILAMAITGFGRMWVGAHWPSDVLGGALWASAAVIAICWWVPGLVRKRPR